MSEQMMRATKTFACNYDGGSVAVKRGVTRLSSGHDIVARFPDSFEPDGDVTVERATAAPGARRARKAAKK